MSKAHASPGSTAYARALAEAVEAEGGVGLLQDVGALLDSVATLWASNLTFRSYFLSSEVTRSQRALSMDRLVEGRFPRLLGNFLRLLYRRGRLVLLPEMSEAFGAIVDERMGRVPVTITTALPMSDGDFGRWTRTIRDAIGHEVIVEREVKPEIIAGAVVRVGDRIADGSARRLLAELQKRFIERGTQRHALQS